MRDLVYFVTLLLVYIANKDAHMNSDLKNLWSFSVLENVWIIGIIIEQSQ